MMAGGAAENGVDRGRLDRAERRFWRELWESVPADAAAEHGVELRSFGPVQATVARDLPEVGMMNLILGATERDAVTAGHLGLAIEWALGAGVSPCVPVTPETVETELAERCLSDAGFERSYAWMKFLRDAHPPRFARPQGIEVIELTGGEQAPFGMIAATGFDLPAWGSAFFASLPGRAGFHCYVARVDDEPQACAAMLIDEGVAEFGSAATLAGARGRGCQLALLHQRILDAAAAGCDTLFVETGERVPDRPSASYRNILRAGFKESYLRPNWRR
jgi:hypothetical protein